MSEHIMGSQRFCWTNVLSALISTDDGNTPPFHSASTPTMTTTTTTVSAPGKVLLVGGYLVLESGNVGLVVAADKRFYSTVETSSAGNGTNPQNTSTIVVTSPQFHASWTYTLMIGSEEDNVNFLASDEIALVPSSDENGTASGENPFVEKTLRVVLAYLFQRIRDKKTGSKSSTTPFMFPTSIHITVKADNDFYSVVPHLDGRPRTPDNVDALPKFLNCPLDPTTGKAVVNKTGLGSSAALVTSLVASLFYHFQTDIASSGGIGGSRHSSAHDQDPNEEEEDEEEELNTQEVIHNLAQLCHCHAQGKVGSGFDVSAAIHGTHIYRRFPKCVLPDVMNQLSPESNHHHLCSHNDPTTNVTGSTAQLVTNVVHSTWSNDMQTPLMLPKGLQLMLADVCGGSESPSMASKVVTWKQQHIQQGTMQVPHWSDLEHLNARFVGLMQTLSTQTIDTDALSQVPATEWPHSEGDETSATSLLRQLHDTVLQIRTELRQLGEAANVPIEPPEQTELCDATMQVPGVVATMVPGAGGYDAVACLFIDTPQVKCAIGKLWETWNKNEQMICPLAVQSSNLGLRLEDP